jgi:hypothetical protein
MIVSRVLNPKFAPGPGNLRTGPGLEPLYMLVTSHQASAHVISHDHSYTHELSSFKDRNIRVNKNRTFSVAVSKQLL